MVDDTAPDRGQQPPPEVVLTQMLAGVWLGQALYVAAKLGLADLLAAGPRSAAELARAADANADAVHRLLRALAGVGVFRQTATGEFELTPLAAGLRRDVPGSVRALALMFGAPWHWRTQGELLHNVRTGGSAFTSVMGREPFAYFAQDPEAQAVFNDAMTAFAAQTDPAIVAAYDFTGIGTLVDVGGGHGSLLAAILRANPALRGILFDLPEVVAGARPVLEAAGVADRCEIVEGSFFDTVPAGGDAYLVKSIVHGWHDERAAGILVHCRRAMGANGRLLVIETVIQPGNEPALGKLLDIEMLLMTDGGRERTEAEFRTLLAAAGFQLTRVLPTRSPQWIVEGVPAP